MNKENSRVGICKRRRTSKAWWSWWSAALRTITGKTRTVGGGAKTLRHGRLGGGHVMSRDGCVVKHALSIIILIDPLYWMILGQHSAWL